MPGAKELNEGFTKKLRPPSMLYCMGEVPPLEIIWIEPLFRPLQVTLVATPCDKTGLGALATDMFVLVVHPLASVTSAL